ncbi:MAG: HAMP domain-containing sensor histidine kinase [Mariprofundaceae bacterium]|nr:HAMP domain-containing sensor histidine kinase [Mariprofundaceae bacterium]
MMNAKEKKEQGNAFSISKQDMAQLMYVFSHDLRNPLINMRALTSDIQMSLEDAGQDPVAVCRAVREELPESLAMMEEVMYRMHHLISGSNEIYHCMFDELECEHIDLTVWVQRELARQKDRMKSTEISVSVGELSTFWADPLAMGRIIKELLDNALRFTPHGGSILVHTETRHGLDVLVVRDSGAGMNQNDLERAFQPFFSVDANRLGMGLAIIKAFVHAHGGQTWCESTLDMGSIFYVAMPHRAIHK